MNPEVQRIITDLDSINSIEDPTQLEKLGNIVIELSERGSADQVVDALLRVFERFPSGDAYGIFWTMLSVLEITANYEPSLIASVKRQPSEFGLLMINRMLNGGRIEVAGENLLSILKDVAADDKQTEELRKEAHGFIEHQEKVTRLG